MKKLFCLFLLPISQMGKGQKFIDLQARPLLAQAMEFCLILSTFERGRAIWFPDTNIHTDLGYPIALHDGCNYKLVYWENFDSPVVCGTVTFDRNIDVRTAAVDSTMRMLSPAELKIFKMIVLVNEDRRKSRDLEGVKNAYPLIVPIHTVWGSKAYVIWRTPDFFIFGADHEYVFNSKGDIVSRTKGHSKSHIYFMGTDTTKPYSAAGLHNHRKGNQGMLIPDLGRVLFYNRFKMNWSKFLLAAKDHLFVVDLSTLEITQFNYPFRLKEKLLVNIMDKDNYKIKSE